MTGEASPRSLWRLAEAVAETVAKAATDVMAHYETDFEVRHKQDRTPVTIADLAAHEIISDGLSAIEPGVPIVSEGKLVGIVSRSDLIRFILGMPGPETP